LLFPLANVLGHLSRTLALAEQLCKNDQDVYLAASDDYADLLALADPRIKHLSSVEMYADATKSFGQISYPPDGHVNEQALLEASTHLEVAELQRRSKCLEKIIDRDTEIIEQVRPDVIVIDYHFAPLLVPKAKGVLLFCISHRVGYPSLCRRVNGEYPYPLNENSILVPGISSFENAGVDQDSDQIKNNWMMCGMFSWEGWQRIDHIPEKNDVLLFFGSTGCTEQLTPWFIDKLQSRYKLSYVNQEREDRFLNLGPFLKQTSLIICHGGHETVMECIKQKKPVIIVPNNLEQLEIGRRVEELKLGILIAQPYYTIDVETLTGAIDKLIADQEIKDSLEWFAAELVQADGAKVAADIIMKKLYDDIEEKSAIEITPDINQI
jgi:UDP:flavonoid glycosyltransferase YjiC (YdhE family)